MALTATTAYFATIESLRDMTDPQQAALAVEEGQLHIEVIGAPRQKASSQEVRDRVEAAGGTTQSDEKDGRRRLVFTLPLDAPIPTRLQAQAGLP